MKKLQIAALACLVSLNLFASEDDLDKAVSLYNNGLYAQSMNILQSLPEYGKDAIVDGYIVLCAQKQHTDGYEKLIEGYYNRYASCSLCAEIRKEQALDHFEKGDYEGALAIFEQLQLRNFSKKQLPEYFFKKGYCYYKTGSEVSAVFEFDKVDRMPMNDYSAPAQYVAGYISYEKGEFHRALSYFEKSSRDERFMTISNYYIINCKYELHDYDFVIHQGVEMFSNEKTPADRKAHLARIISESYLVQGNKDQARKFYEDADDGSPKSRADYFFAGSLLYVTGEYQGAVENYSKMPDKVDSLGQIAWYQTALSYVALKNKVSALDAFRSASSLDYDRKMTEDAYFNYAKLSFDLNGDTSVFGDYIKRYSDKVRGEKIYSYMALAALANRDYQGAIDAYDKIDVLEGQEKRNYVNANYLRGAELLENGSYRRAVQSMKAVTYYTPRTERVNQLARYALAEAYYLNGQYADARAQYSDLYNTSALYGLEQGEALSYNLAYVYFKEEDYANAGRWFATYMSDGGKKHYKDAMLRSADCVFVKKDYAHSAQAYQAYVDKFFDVNEVYPYYRAAICYGLSMDPKSKKKAEQKAILQKKIELLSMARTADPKAQYYPEAILELGKTLSGADRNAEALAVLEELVGRAPVSVPVAQATLEIGTLKRNSGDIEGALAAYGTVVEKMSYTGLSDDALLAIESIYQSQNQPQKYIAYLDRIGKGATKTEQEREQMIFASAEQLFYDDDYSRAIDAFKAFMDSYPKSEKMDQAWYYIAESWRLKGDKEQACDAYLKLFEYEQSTRMESAVRQYAALNFSMDNFEKSQKAYVQLLTLVPDGQKKVDAYLGLMRSSYRAKDYATSIEASAQLLSQASPSPEILREARYLQARSLLATSRRDEAFKLLETLSAEPTTVEGAEAAYMIIQDCYDKADFEAVRTKVYAFSDSGTGQTFYLAKAFIVLGDSFAEQGKLKQAEATFKSVAEGFSESPEINEEIQLRLQKISQMQ